MFKRILVPLDGSALSEKALPMAAALASKFEGLLVLLHIFDASAYWMPDKITHPAGSELLMELHEQARRNAEQYLSEQGEALGQQGLNVRTILYDDTPAEGIIDVAKAEDIDLIIICTHGYSGVKRWAYGSVADRVARYGPCPVLLVR